ncbi:MAG: hypothetical protein GC151_07215 [Betaproteobacteria bacterium]|nr:hypothetical protein [Betaproteobacteria bacterium]
MPDTLYLAIAERTSAQAAAQLSLPTYDPDYVLKLAKGDKPMPPDLRDRIRNVVQLHIFSRKRLRGLDETVALRREGILFLPDGQQLLDRTREVEALGRDTSTSPALRVQYLWVAMTGCFRLARPRAGGAGSHAHFLESICTLGDEMRTLAEQVYGADSVWYHLARVNVSSARFQLLAMRNQLSESFLAEGHEICRAAARDCPWWVEVHRDALEYAALLGRDDARDEALLRLCEATRSRPAGWVLSIAQHGMERAALDHIRRSALYRQLEDAVTEDRTRLRAVTRVDRRVLETLRALVNPLQGGKAE